MSANSRKPGKGTIRKAPGRALTLAHPGYAQLLTDISGLLEAARRGAATSVNAILTATYWQIGRRIVEHEQGGLERAEYGTELIAHLAADLTRGYGRGFSKRNIEQMRAFYLGWEIAQTPSAQFEARAAYPAPSSESAREKPEILQTVSAESNPGRIRP